MHSVASDIRYGLRTLRRQPVLTTVALAILALGIGGSAGIFSVVNAVILRPLPFAEPDRLVSFWGTAPEMGLSVVNYPDALYSYHRQRSRMLEILAAYTGAGFTLTGRGDATRVTGQNVTSEFFSVLGVRPALGRDFRREEATRGNNLVTILSHGLWQRLGGDSSIIGASISLDGLATTVVGIMPRGFDFPNHSELWVPIGIDPSSTDCWCYNAIGRMRGGITTDDVAREVDALNEAFFDELNPNRVKRARPKDARGTVVVSLADALVGKLHDPVLLLLGAVGVVLLVACANLANLLLARATARERELAIRASLGASAGRVARQLLVESALLSLGGALIGLVIATWISRVLGSFALERLPHLQTVGIDGRVIVFAGGLSVLTALLFGLAPALRSSRLDLQSALREGSRGSHGTLNRRVSNGFVIGQVALSVVLLVASGLLVRSFANLINQETGFNPENVVVARAVAGGTAYQSDTSVRQLFSRLEEKLRARRELSSVALSSTAPFSSGEHQRLYFIEGKPRAPGEPDLVMSIRSVTPGYFSAIGTPLVEGRAFTDNDRLGSELVAIVDESLAQLEWPNGRGDAIGKRIRFQNSPNEPWRTVVGIARSIKHGDLAKAPDRYVYLPFAQATQWRMDIVARSTLAPASVATLLRREMANVDPAIPLFDVHTVQEAVSASLDVQRLLFQLLIAFAIAAMLLAAVGLYGVMVLNVTMRFREFGVRMALGASPAALLRSVVRGGLVLAVAGIAVGLAGAMAAARLVRALLFGVSATDPVTYVAVAGVLGLVVLLASYLPARRAASADPLVALREE
jgi:putative ABC transport system permease protein